MCYIEWEEDEDEEYPMEAGKKSLERRRAREWKEDEGKVEDKGKRRRLAASRGAGKGG